MPGKHAAPSRIKAWPRLVALTKAAVGAVTPYSKAITGALFGGVAMWLKVRGHGVTNDEVWQILGAAASGGGLIYAVPNRDPRGRKQDESVQPPNRPEKPGEAGRRVVRHVKGPN